MATRNVDLAVGFKDGTWKEVTIEVPEDDNYVLEHEEAKQKAKDILGSASLGKEIAFVHTMSVDDPEGGYAEDRWM